MNKSEPYFCNSIPVKAGFDIAFARKLAIEKPHYDESLSTENALVNPLTREEIVYHIHDWGGVIQASYYTPG